MATNNLVLGSEGFVGKAFCKYLETKNENVIRVDYKLSPDQDLRYAKLDFSNIDKIFFLAWEVGGSKYLYNNNTQLDQIDWNMRLLTNIMPQIYQSNIPFLFVSSQLAEITELAYGVLKRAGEIWSKQIGGSIVRLWNVYGPIETPSERTHVVADLIYQAVIFKKIELMTTGEEKRQFIHIDDVCDAFYNAINLKTSDIFDVTSFEWISISDVASIISSYTEADIIYGKTIGNTPLTPIKGKIPGWIPKVSLDEGIYKMIIDMKTFLSEEKK